MSAGPVIGALALQGDFDAHARALGRLGVDSRPVRKVEQLAGLAGLVIPGGESTTLIKLMDAYGFWEPLRGFIDAGHPVFGTCAGAILLAAEVLNPPQPSLGAIDVTVERNSYGRQKESFEGTGTFTGDGTGTGAGREIEMVFIRAPRLVRLGDAVQPLAECRGDTVMARQDNVLVATFHPELGSGSQVHEYFLGMVDGARR